MTFYGLRLLRIDYPDTVGDIYLFGRLRQLADPDLALPPLVISSDQSSCRGCEVRLTEAGEAFLDGRMNFVKENGIDDWVAGVHLNSQTREVWYRDPQSSSHLTDRWT
jgi:hypothetical protein